MTGFSISLRSNTYGVLQPIYTSKNSYKYARALNIPLFITLGHYTSYYALKTERHIQETVKHLR